MVYNNSERSQLHGIIICLLDAVRADGFKAAQHWRETLGSYVGSGNGLCADVGELFELSGKWVANEGERPELKQKIFLLSESILKILFDSAFDRFPNSTIRRG
jgi:hypothetical protein